MIGIKTCLNCERRFPNCHSTCEDYIQEKKALNDFNEKIRLDKEEYGKFYEYRSQCFRKYSKSKK